MKMLSEVQLNLNQQKIPPFIIQSTVLISDFCLLIVSRDYLLNLIKNLALYNLFFFIFLINSL